jgi:hypothetical protein
MPVVAALSGDCHDSRRASGDDFPLLFRITPPPIQALGMRGSRGAWGIAGCVVKKRLRNTGRGV